MKYDLSSYCGEAIKSAANLSFQHEFEIFLYSSSNELQSNVSQNTKAVQFHFPSREKRDKYLEYRSEIKASGLEYILCESEILKGIGTISFQREKFSWASKPNTIYDDYNRKVNKKWAIEVAGDCGAVGVGSSFWEMYIYNPPPTWDDHYPGVIASSRNHSVCFFYTCDFDYDMSMIDVMNRTQLESVYREITFTPPDVHLSDQDIKNHIELYCDPVRSRTVIGYHMKYNYTGSGPSYYLLPGYKVEYRSRMFVKPGDSTIELLNENKQRIYTIYNDSNENGSKYAKFAIHVNANEKVPTGIGIESGVGTSYCNFLGGPDGGFVAFSSGEIPEEGIFQFNVFLGYQDDTPNESKISFSNSGYNEAIEEIEAAIQAAQELRSLYIAYKDVFEEAFKAVIAKPEYADLMLNEELLTIYDSGPEVAVINEQLFHLGYGSTPNGYNYTSETYDGVIKFKDYLKELDSDLYDILEIGIPCGDNSIHPKCSSNSQDGPCGCWTYSCYIFKEITFRTTSEKDAQVRWTSTSKVNSPFKEIIPNGVHVNGTSTIFVDNEDGLGNRSIHATVNNGYEVKVRIWAHGYLNNNTNNLVKFAPDDSDLSTNIPLSNGERLTPFASPAGDAYYLDLTLRGSDVLKVEAVHDANEPFLMGLNRISPTGQIRTVDVGSVTLFSNGPFSIEKLELEVLDVRPPYADWKIHGHSSPPGWGRVNGVAGITLVAENFSDGLYDTAPPCSFGIQIEIFLGIEIFYIFEIEIGGFVGLKLNFGIENGGGNYAHNFISGKYVQASVDIGLAKASGRLEATDEWEWRTPKQLGFAVKDWLNDFIIDDDYKLPLPKGYAGRTSKTISKVETEVLGQTVSQAHETQENAVSLEFVNDSSPILNTLQIYSNQSKDKTRISFGRKWSDGGTVGADAPTYPSASVSVTNPTIKERALYASIQYLANVLEIPPESVVFSVASWASKYGNLASFWKTYQNATKLFSMGNFASFGGKTGITWDYELYVGLKFMFEEWLDLGNSDFNSGPSETVIETQLNQNAQNWTFGAGLDFNAKAGIGFKIYTYPCAFVSVYFGAKLKFEISASPEWNLIGATKWGTSSSSQDLVALLENQEGSGG